VTEYAIVIEDAGSNFSSCVVGLDGCVATGQTIEEVENNMRDAIEFHLEGMRLHGDQLPANMPIIKTVQVAS
jgi:predicted RNase H-like HicB family nuclease